MSSIIAVINTARHIQETTGVGVLRAALATVATGVIVLCSAQQGQFSFPFCKAHFCIWKCKF